MQNVAENAYAVVVTNKHEVEKTTVTALKVWQDNDNEFGVRPEQIVIALLANGQIVEEVVLNDSNAWTYTWADLYQYANGERIVYTVDEITADSNYVVGYTIGEGPNGEAVWQITNTVIDVTPGTGDAIHAMFLLMIFSMAGVLLLLPTVRKKEQETAQ